MNKKIAGQLCAACIVLTFLIFLDQYTKTLVVNCLQNQEDFIVIDGVFRLTYLENYGAAFGTWNNSKYFLMLLTAFIMVIVLYCYIRLLLRRQYLGIRLLCLGILAGGVGNLIDRILRGYVVDFLYFELINFPVFNVADCYITCCTILLIILICTRYKDTDFSFLSPFYKKNYGEEEK